jgi:hypothetical protein
MPSVFETLWNLRANPFDPAEDFHGTPFNPGFLLGSLDPQADPRSLGFYYDVYDWEFSKLVGGIDAAGALKRFPNATLLSAPKSLMALIWGTDDSGCESLQNLILHKIQKQHNQGPLIVRVHLESSNGAENVKFIARMFMRYYAREVALPTYEDLNRDYEMETAQQGAGRDSYFASLFQIWELDIRNKSGNRPIVLVLTGADQYEAWRVIYYSTAYLFNYIIVLTKDEQEARSCFLSLERAHKNVVLIRTRELPIEDAKAYLESRISKQRLAATGSGNAAEPFSVDALRSLYAPGSRSKELSGLNADQGDRGAVAFSIGWLNKRFHRALQEHLSKLRAIAEAKGLGTIDDLAPQHLDPKEMTIGPGGLLDANEKIYKNQ